MQVLTELESFVQGFIKHHNVSSLLWHLLDKKSEARIHKYEEDCTLDVRLYKMWPPFHCWESEKLTCVRHTTICAVVSIVASQKDVRLQAGAHMLEWVGKCPQSKDLHVRLTGR